MPSAAEQGARADRQPSRLAVVADHGALDRLLAEEPALPGSDGDAVDELGDRDADDALGRQPDEQAGRLVHVGGHAGGVGDPDRRGDQLELAGHAGAAERVREPERRAGGDALQQRALDARIAGADPVADGDDHGRRLAGDRDDHHLADAPIHREPEVAQLVRVGLGEVNDRVARQRLAQPTTRRRAAAGRG